jgi:tetratricopeptide (TPR) repeat protein
MLYDGLGRKDEAVALFHEVIALEPEFAEAYYSLGLLVAERPEQLAEAADFLGKAAELAPERARIHYNYGLALQRLDRPEEAEKALSAACKLAPSNVDFLYALAVLYTQQERWARAVACLEELVRRRPNERQFRQLLEYAKREGRIKEEG